MSGKELAPSEEDVVFLKASDVSTTTNAWFQSLYGRVMTIIEAGMPGGSQCNAMKDLAGQAIWIVYNEMWDDLSRRLSVK